MTRLPREVHDAHGAVRQADTDTVRNYGDPAVEYAAARERAVIAERHDTVLLRATGRDPVKMLQGLVTNDLAGAPEDRAVYAAVLTPKGKMVADVMLVRDGGEVLLSVHAAAEQALLGHLKKYVPPLFARFSPAALVPLALYGPGAASLLREVCGIAAPPEQDAVTRLKLEDESIVAIATSHFDVPGYDLWAGASAGAELWRRLVAAGAVPAGESTLDVLRIEAGTPVWGSELDDATIPLEAGLRHRAISETKGCYTGQEVIIRILHRGHVNWHLRRLHLGDGDTPPRGAAIVNAEGRKVGRVTSATWSPRAGEVIGLGYVRREVEPGSVLQLESGGDVRMELLP